MHFVIKTPNWENWKVHSTFAHVNPWQNRL